jgi:hypothetical protein
MSLWILRPPTTVRRTGITGRRSPLTAAMSLVQSSANNWMPSDLLLICQERARLLHEFADAALDYATSVREMAEFVRSGDEVRASESRRISRRLLSETEKSRLALYRHEADHTCDRNISETAPEPTA